MLQYITVFFLVGAVFVSGEYGKEKLDPTTRALKITVERSQNLLVVEENTISTELRNIYLFNDGNKVRAAKLAKYLNENNFCEIHNGWNVLIIDDAFYDRHTFRITETSTKFFAVKTHGFGYPEEIYVIFNECQVAEETSPAPTSEEPITVPTTTASPPTVSTPSTEPPIPTMSI